MGFEEIEGLTVVDMFRRAGIPIQTVSISDSLTVTGSHDIKVQADCLLADFDFNTVEMLILPGGMPGTTNLSKCEPLCDALMQFSRQGRYLAAICAAPSILGSLGILNGRVATCYPGFEKKLFGAYITTGSRCQRRSCHYKPRHGYSHRICLHINRHYSGS